MDNSFYYFFSATPQVLGAILALFGVFVIFKIQSIKNQLIGIGSRVKAIITLASWNHALDKITEIRRSFDEALREEEIKNIELSLRLLNDEIIDTKKTNQKILEELKDIKDQELKAHKRFQFISWIIKNFEDIEGYPIRFNIIYNTLKSVIKDTIIWSIFTACIIIICLAILSRGSYFLCHPELLSVIFWIIIALIATSFSGLIYILIKSLKES